MDLKETMDDPAISDIYKSRLMAVKLSVLNAPRWTIAKVLDVSQDSVTNYLKLYRDEGLSGVLENHFYRPSSSVEAFLVG